jgi:hypothetical protein
VIRALCLADTSPDFSPHPAHLSSHTLQKQEKKEKYCPFPISYKFSNQASYIPEKEDIQCHAHSNTEIFFNTRK